jgi:hypothetical protein
MLCWATGRKALQFFSGEDHAHHVGSERFDPNDLGEARFVANTAGFLGLR